MSEEKRCYIAIDLKSFYASVECVERDLDPLTTHLVVADQTRTEKTICLAVSPSLKAYGISGRARLFEVVQKVREINAKRRQRSMSHELKGSSFDARELQKDPLKEVTYVTAVPRMALYIDYSTRIYHVYLKYVAKEDIHVYSIDEVFMDVSEYLNTYKLSAHELAKKIIQDVYNTTGITATAGIGSNLYLCKVAMDIVAKHIAPDQDGVRIAELNELQYRKLLWDHRPLTDFWRVGRGYARKLEEHGLYTMGDIARCSLDNEELLYRLFGVNAELLIDHAWGWEPCTIKDVKAYKPKANSLGSGQVLHTPYPFDKARLIVKEMIDVLMLQLVDKGLVCNQIVLTIGYDIDNLNERYTGEVTIDHYGRKIPKHAHGSANLTRYTSSTKLATQEVLKLYDRIVDRNLWVRRISISAQHVVSEQDAKKFVVHEQIDLFSDTANLKQQSEEEEKQLESEKELQKALLDIKKKYGKNAVVKGMNLEEGATTLERNKQIGGHKA